MWKIDSSRLRLNPPPPHTPTPPILPSKDEICGGGAHEKSSCTFWPVFADASNLRSSPPPRRDSLLSVPVGSSGQNRAQGGGGAPEGVDFVCERLAVSRRDLPPGIPVALVPDHRQLEVFRSDRPADRPRSHPPRRGACWQNVAAWQRGGGGRRRCCCRCCCCRYCCYVAVAAPATYISCALLVPPGCSPAPAGLT